MKVTKNTIQDQARQSIKDNGGSAILLMATGTGKSRVGVLEAVEELDNSDFEGYELPMICVPNVKLRDNSWKDEFEKWGYGEYYKSTKTVCYASLNKESGKKYRLILLDEGHRITPENYKFFKNNQVERVVILTATKPKDKQKLDLLLSLAPITFTYTLDEAVRDGLVSPFTINVIKVPLDKITKNIKCGSKTKSWYSTEYLQYQYLTSVIDSGREKFNEWKEENGEIYPLVSQYATEVGKKKGDDYLCQFKETKRGEILKGYKKYSSLESYIMIKVLDRVRFIGNLMSKEKIVDDLITKLITSSKRFLVFCAGIDQAERLGKGYTFHSKTNSDAFNAFCDLSSDFLLVVDAVNEGLNIPAVDDSIVGKLNSNDINFIQRTGRIIRYRDDHRARVFIVTAENTADEDWLKASLKTFDKENIFYYTQETYHNLFGE